VIDQVHDLQRAYRRVLRATASPGSVEDLRTEAAALGIPCTLFPATLLLALLLLDAEVAFAVTGEGAAELGRLMSQLTLARLTPPPEAEFLFVSGPASEAASAFRSASVGTLADPHRGATIVLEVESLSPGGPLVLTGPGIEREHRLCVGRNPDWIALRAERNQEYPLGVDLCLVDRRDRLASLPRTTDVAIEE
jgi:alpha-D-ribose 1-methylphosphonate 5-triphosphate synthase subunit PhnH